MAPEDAVRVVREPETLFPVLGAVDLDGPVGQQAEIVAAVAERREPEDDRVDPVVEVLAEPSRPDARREVLVRRGDETEVHFLGRFRPDPLDGLLLQCPKELRLHPGRHVPDLVQEERPPLRLLEPPLVRPDGPRERAPLVPEQLGLQQRLGNSRAVDGHERAAVPRGDLVDLPRDQLLARPRLALDKDGNIVHSHQPDQGGCLEHPRAPADHPRDLRGRGLFSEIPDLPRQAGALDRTPDDDAKIGQIDRLLEVVVGALLHGPMGHLAGTVGRHHDDQRVGGGGANPPEKVEPVHVGKTDVEKDHVRTLRRDHPEGGGAGLRLPRGVPLFPQRLSEEEAHPRVIFHDQDGAAPFRRHVRASRSPAETTGRRTVKTVSSPVVRTSIDPPWAVTIWCVIVRPRPVPPGFVE